MISYPTLHYLYSLFTILILNCLNPINWSNCLPVHQWLPPYITDYTDYIEEWVSKEF